MSTSPPLPRRPPPTAARAFFFLGKIPQLFLRYLPFFSREDSTALSFLVDCLLCNCASVAYRRAANKILVVINLKMGRCIVECYQCVDRGAGVTEMTAAVKGV